MVPNLRTCHWDTASGLQYRPGTILDVRIVDLLVVVFKPAFAE